MANINRYDDLNTGAIAYATLVSCIVLVFTILGLRALCCAWIESEEDRRVANAHYLSADQEISEQRALLAGYEKTVVEVTPPAEEGQDAQPVNQIQFRIPIEKAKDLLLSELSDASPEA